MKYGLFDPARMWVTKNGVSKDFYNPEELRLFLDSFQSQPKDSTNSTNSNRSHNIVGDDKGNGTVPSGKEKANTPYTTLMPVKEAEIWRDWPDRTTTGVPRIERDAHRPRTAQGSTALTTYLPYDKLIDT
ncbi:hypothetical protein NDU88_006862 [Pleurodeles waltl]|uniref:Uncharacterized protein n=1 Tax=Pleurodeles waltl TaxID=8319 RepID=A0AAV7WBS9_PLEWA|nr:hypothetical protein NDU88_006862 [Pleurodeles waltl]